MTSLDACLSTVPLCSEYDKYNDGLFLTTNESNQNETLDKLRRICMNGNTAIGVSGCFILNAVAIRGYGASPLSAKKIEQIVIVDRDVCVEQFWDFMRNLLQKPNLSREAAKQAIEKEIISNSGKYWPNNSSIIATGYKEILDCEIECGISFLSDETKFQVIHKIAMNGNLIFKRLDMFDPASLTAVAEALKKEGHAVDMVYVSNVSEYASNPVQKSGFLKSVEQIVDVATLVIAAESSKGTTTQRVMRRACGKKITADSFSYTY